ncbi:hypothetical protein BV20DRAFT_1051593 [Pilatotrama ljubarskyi]|nr:hypothetical protein BV20DRAFT_1051593 [Pilatotrama ljubarskyi]
MPSSHPRTSRVRVQEPPPSPTPSASSPVLPFDAPMFSQPVFKTRREQTGTSASFLYQHVRDLCGIKQSFSSPVVNTTSVPSCGGALDTYLQAHGFDVDSKLIVARACQVSITTGDFVEYMVDYGLPVLEVKYMWVLYESDSPGLEWANTYIM